TDYTPYRVSVSYTNQQGIIKENGYQRLTGGIALTPQFLNNHLSLNINMKGSHEKNDFIENPIGSALSFDPTRPVYSDDSSHGLGYFIWENSAGNPISTAGTNPVAMLMLRDDGSKVNRFFGNVQGDYKIHGLEELRLNVNYGFDLLKSDGHVYLPDNSPQSWTGVGNDGQGLDRKYVQEKRTTQLEMYANYNKEFGIHGLDIMGGYSWQHFWNSYDNHEANLTGDKIYQSFYREREYYLISFFGRINYNLNNKYLLTATVRDDGSSRFGKDNRWGLFPSVAVAWKMNEELFLAGVDFLSDLKLRLSYGKTGQQDITQNANKTDVSGYYDYMPIYSFSEENAKYQLGDTYYTTIRPDGYDPNLKWETTTTYNIGLDYGFMNGRIYGSVDAYIRKTDDLLNKITFPAASNLTDMLITNIGSLENKGIEFAVTAVPIQKKDLSWDVNFNVTYNKGKITKLNIVDDPTYKVDVGSISGGIGSTAQVHTVGYAPYTFFLKKQVYDASGNPIEGEYEETDYEDNKYYGKKAAPDVFMGLSSKVNYKQWSFGFNSHANIGNYVFNNVKSSQSKEGVYGGNVTYSNILKFTRDKGFEGNQYWSDYFLSNASFFKMDNISVGYNIPKLGKSDISLRITATCENVFTITGYGGLDPEVENGIDKNLYSRPRTFMIGFNFNL
ncbi:MAG: SusC/RagA family TonB-linked outer membrane protein, partial [Tannerellaceae bacterium]|nr:SusC/RagA family TonB-linked outer membrane protein [Tannerellaceae bacterium]